MSTDLSRINSQNDRLTLFDIDYTLTVGFDADSIAFDESLKNVYGLDVSDDPIDFIGKTHMQIATEILSKHGFDQFTIKSKLHKSMDYMVSRYNELADSYHIEALGGTKELLSALREKGVLLGLITGNVEGIAWGKVNRAGLGDYFKFGAFGSDDMERSNLIRIAIRKAEEGYGFIFHNNVFVLGDSPRDISAGRKVGVKTIGVTTGIFSRQQLLDSGADYVVKNLLDTNKILKIIL